jgi:hypothetical protein
MSSSFDSFNDPPDYVVVYIRDRETIDATIDLMFSRQKRMRYNLLLLRALCYLPGFGLAALSKSGRADCLFAIVAILFVEWLIFGQVLFVSSMRRGAEPEPPFRDLEIVMGLGQETLFISTPFVREAVLLCSIHEVSSCPAGLCVESLPGAPYLIPREARVQGHTFEDFEATFISRWKAAKADFEGTPDSE